MILRALAASSQTPETETTDELKIIEKCSSLARSQTMVNFYFNESNRYVEAPLTLVPALVGSDWIVRRSVDPGYLSLLLLGNSLMQNKSNNVEKNNLKLRS